MSRETYSSLFSVIGTSFGEGDGEDTFNVPDLRESVPKGVGLNPNGEDHVSEEGLALGEFLDDRLQEHRHNCSLYKELGSASSGSSAWRWAVSVPTSPILEETYDGIKVHKGPTTEVKSVGVNYIIKY